MTSALQSVTHPFLTARMGRGVMALRFLRDLVSDEALRGCEALRRHELRFAMRTLQDWFRATGFVPPRRSEARHSDQGHRI